MHNNLSARIANVQLKPIRTKVNMTFFPGLTRPSDASIHSDRIVFVTFQYVCGRAGGNAEEFKKVTAAYKVISYDRRNKLGQMSPFDSLYVRAHIRAGTHAAIHHLYILYVS